MMPSCEQVAKDFSDYLVGTQEIERPWEESNYFLFGRTKPKTTLLLVWIDDHIGWDGNLKLLFLKESLGLIDYYVVHWHRGFHLVSTDTILQRMDILSSIIPTRKLFVKESYYSLF